MYVVCVFGSVVKLNDDYVLLINKEGNILNQSLLFNYQSNYIEENVYYSYIQNPRIVYALCCINNNLTTIKYTNDNYYLVSDNSYNFSVNCLNKNGLQKFLYNFTSVLCFKKLILKNITFNENNMINPIINITELYIKGVLHYNNSNIWCNNYTDIYNLDENKVSLFLNTTFSTNDDICRGNNTLYYNNNILPNKLNYSLNGNILSIQMFNDIYELNDNYKIRYPNSGCIIIDENIICDNYICSFYVNCLEDDFKYLNISLQYDIPYYNTIINPSNNVIVKLNSISYPNYVSDGYKNINILSGSISNKQYTNVLYGKNNPTDTPFYVSSLSAVSFTLGITIILLLITIYLLYITYTKYLNRSYQIVNTTEKIILNANEKSKSGTDDKSSQTTEEDSNGIKLSKIKIDNLEKNNFDKEK